MSNVSATATLAETTANVLDMLQAASATAAATYAANPNSETLANLMASFAAVKAITNPAPIAPVALAPNAYAGGAPLAATITYCAPNPKKPGSAAHARYNLYPTAPFTLNDVLKGNPLGPNKADFLYDLRKGYLVIGA